VLVAVPAACWDCQWEAFPPAAERMWDSAIKRWRARSLARNAALSSGSSWSDGVFLVLVAVCAASWLWSGGREDWAGCQQFRKADRTEQSYEVSFELPLAHFGGGCC
jgi:hypothetical protein